MNLKHITFFNGFYNLYLQNHEFSVEDGLPYWRERIFNGFMLAFFIFGSLAIIPNLIASFQGATYLIAAYDIFFYISICFLFFYKRIKLSIKVSATVFLIYTLSIILLVELGPMGPGLIWFASASLVAALFLGFRASVLTIIINALIIVILALIIKFGKLNTLFFNSYNLLSWVAISMNVLIFNGITSIPIVLLLNALEKANRSENQLMHQISENLKIIEEEKEKAEESDRLKTAFLQNLSHEIRTPMNAIIGFSDLLSNQNLSVIKQLEYKEIITNSSNQLLAIVNDVLTISSLETNQVRISLAKVDVNALLHELVQIFERQLKGKNILIQLTNPYQNKNFIYTDITKLRQIISNLLANAVKFTNKGTIELGYENYESFVEFYIKDTGIGFSADMNKKIFERFRQADLSISKTYGGTGLGLSISKEFIELMGGKIWAESELGKGSVFYFTIPSYSHFKSP